MSHIEPTSQWVGRHGSTMRWVVIAAAAIAGLVAVMAAMGPGLFTIDENAYLLQAEIVETESRWVLPYPTDGLVEQTQFAPLSLSATLDSGWMPHGRHPLYIEILAAARPVGARFGPAMVSVLGAVIAALGVARLGVWSGVRSTVGLFWASLLATPLLFHSQVVWAHAPAAAITVWAAVFLVSADTRSWRSILAASALIVVGTMLRSEVALMAPSIAVGVVWLRRGQRQLQLTLVGAIVGSTVLGLALDRFLMARTWDGSRQVIPLPDDDTFFADRFQSALSVLLDPGSIGINGVTRLLSVLLLVLAARSARAAGRASTDTIVLAGLGALAAIIGAVTANAIPGLLPAIPGLVVGLVVATSSARRATLLLIVATHVCLVLATAPANGGGLGWGGRYLLVSVPLLFPVAWAGLEQLWLRRHRTLLAAVAVVVLAVQLTGLRSIRTAHQFSEIVSEQAGASLAGLEEGGEPMIAADIRIGRIAPDVARDVPMMSVNDESHLADALGVVEDAGIETAVIVDLFNSPDLELPNGWSFASERLEKSIRLTVVTR